jgi:hypothetical protein
MRAASLLIATIAFLTLATSTDVNAQKLDTPPSNLTPAAKKVWVKLHSIVVESPSVPPEDLGKTLAYLVEQSKERDPEHIGVRIVLTDTSPAKKSGIQTADGRLHPIHRETEKWGDMPLGECLFYICQMTGHDFKIEGDAVIVFPAKSQPPTK